MGADAFNLSQWVRRLGWKRPDEPPVLFSIQPVQIVSDVCGLTSSLRPPSALWGGEQVGVAAEHGTFQIQAQGPGGLCVRRSYGSRNYAYGIAAAPETLTAPVTVLTQNFAPDFPAASSAQIGTIPAAAAAIFNNGLRPVQIGGFGDAVYCQGGLWVPPGEWWIMVNATVNDIIAFAFIAEEPPGDRAS